MKINNNKQKEVHQYSQRLPERRARVYSVADIFGEERQVHILHNDEEYRLSLTRNGKLILTK